MSEEKEIIYALEDLRFEPKAQKFVDKAIKIIDKQQKEIEKLKEIIIAIRHELKGNVISKDEKGDYRPTKNLTKQQVYESYVKLNLLLKANYIFKEDEDVIKELLEE